MPVSTIEPTAAVAGRVMPEEAVERARPRVRVWAATARRATGTVTVRETWPGAKVSVPAVKV